MNTVTVREETHFGQYWALEALQRCLPLADAVTVAALTPKLKEFLSKLPTDSDRHYEPSNLLEQLAEPSRALDSEAVSRWLYDAGGAPKTGR